MHPVGAAWNVGDEFEKLALDRRRNASRDRRLAQGLQARMDLESSVRYRAAAAA